MVITAAPRNTVQSSGASWASARPEGPTNPRLLAWGELAITFAVFLLLYTATLSPFPSLYGDSVYYMNAIDSGVELFHRHHLLYNPFAHMWIAIWKSLGVEIDSVILVSELNAVFGALCLCVFYRLLRGRLKVDRLTAFLGASLPAFSFGFWFYSVSVGVYIIPLFLLLVSFSLLTSEHVDKKTFALVGFLNGLAVLFHQMHVLFAPVVFGAALSRHRRGDTTLWKSFGSYVLTALPIATIPYLWIIFAVAKPKSLQDAWYWPTLYAHISSYWYPPAFSTALKAGIGLGRAFVGSHFIFAVPAIRASVERMLQGYYLAHQAYVVRNMGKGVAYLLVASSVVFFLLLVISLVARAKDISLLSLRERRTVYLLLLWIVVYGSFFFFFVPVNSAYWIPQSVCMWMIFLFLLLAPQANCGELGRRARIILASVAGLIFLLNFMGTIRFTRDRANDYYYVKIAPLVGLSKPKDLIIIGRSWILEPYLHRYGRAQVLSLSSVCEKTTTTSESIRWVRSAIDDKLGQGGSVLISEEAVELEKETIQDYGSRITAFDALWEVYRQRWKKKESQQDAVYVLQ